MIIFIDDSGDPGFKLDKGSTSHFVIAMVIFDDELEAEKTAITIKELKRTFKFNENAEFRFFKTRNEMRLKFLQAIQKHKFRVRCLIVNKELLHSKELRNNKNSFYAYFIKEALKNNNKTISDAKIRIDGGGNRIFRKNFLTYLRRELNSTDSCIIHNCKMVDSKKDVLIQLADMIAGSINRAETNAKSDSKDFKNIIQKHIEDEWYFR